MTTVFPPEHPPIPPTRRGRRGLRTLVTGITGLALVAMLHSPAAEAASQAKPEDETFTPRKEKSVSGVNAPVIPRKPDPALGKALRGTPAVTWPSAAKVTVALPAPGATGIAWDKALSGTNRAGATVQAGSLPIRLGPTATANKQAAAKRAVDSPGKMTVDLLGRKGDRLLFRLNRADGVAKAAPVALRLDYRSFGQAYGGDWNSRLRVVQVPECALTTDCAGKPIPTRNDGSGELSADVPAAGLFAVQAGPSGSAGDFKASSLTPAASWQVGGPSGDFTWRYPMETPPSVGGPTTDLSLDYSSGGVDGRTSATNNQPSWAGEGFEFTPGGSIERRYASCASKPEQSGNNGTRAVGDLCWATDNATFSLNGKGGELVRDDQTGAWRPRGDDGTKVERRTGGNNGDNDGEYWVITNADGTRYYFGLNKLPGATSAAQDTKSAWTVPVFGNHSGEPCHAAAYADSHCQQGYRWNLDYVVDRHGNTMSLFYDIETNNYARNGTAGSVSNYVRNGNVKRIEYGQRDGEVFTKPAVGRITFNTADRCIPGSACTTSQPATFPDTPLDQACNSTTDCNNKFHPTFWTQKRLASVTTEVWRGTGFTPVDSWTLRHTFPDPGDGTRPGLWLEAITNSGHVGGSVSTPEVNFDGIQLPNRVAGIDGIPAMNWWRVSKVQYGTGGELAVVYSPQDCSLPGNVPAPDTNGKRCHPLRWTPEGQAERQDWFNKFVVLEVTESDRVSGLEPVSTKVEYLSPPAWRHDDEDGLVEIGRKTWSQWRGYERVKVTKGHANGPQTVTEHKYFRGMDGDKLSNGTQKDVKVTDSTGAQVEDINALSGQLREQITYNGTTMISRSITDHWVSAPTATRVRSWGTTQAFQVEDQATRQDEAIDGGWRKSSSKNLYDASGTMTAAVDWNDLANPNDDTCTRYEYAANAAAGIKELKAREHTVSVACDQPWTKDDVISDERVYYDNSSTPGGTPTKGDATKGERLAGFDASGNPTYQTVFTAAYDAVGRQTRHTDALSRNTLTAYTPADAAPLTKAVVTQPNGHTKITEFDPAWGEEVAITEADNKRTEIAYDPLGRTDKVWLPGRTRTDTPNMEYDYEVRSDGPGVVSTRTLQTDGSIETSYELTDGLLRPRQKQEAAPGGGRVVTDFIYDSRGQIVKENGQYYNDAPPGTEVLLPREEELPTQKIFEYDGAGRPTAEIFKSQGVELFRTTHGNTANRHTVTPPSGEQPVTKITDVQGRLIEQRAYTGSTASGEYDATTYTYHDAGQLASVRDPAGNTWKFEYDKRGRKISETDPDKGTTTYTYDDTDKVATSTDARGKTLAYAYDAIGRKTAVHEGSLTGPKQAEWVYDTLAKGSPSSASRFVNGQAYTTRVLGYDAGGRSTGMEVTLPAAEGALAGTYTVKNTYNADGEVASTELPAAGGLPAETLTFGYNAQDLPTTLTGLSSYVTGTSYTPFGELDTVTLKQGTGKWIQQKYEYEIGTRRLSRVVTDRETSPRRISSVEYAYDKTGNVKKITDTPSSTTGEAADTQCFNYDHLRRLTGAWTPGNGDCAATPTASALGGPAPYWHSWTFDKVGNRKSETRTTAGGSTVSTYEYPAAGQAKPHALQKVTTTGPAGTTTNTYGYDASGNLANRTVAGAGETFTWNAEGELEKVVKGGQTTAFVYDADGNRMLRRDASGTTLYFGDTELLLQPSGTVTGTRYYNHGKQTVAVRTEGKLTWLGSDHHGTPNLAIDAATQTFQRRRTTPYGELRGAAPTAWPGQKGFVGGTNDPSTGLVHLQAREYDPTTGRFISVDPLADFEDAQQLNGYSYANNSPVTYTDPDGQFAFIPIIILAVRLVPVVVRVVRAVPVVVRTVAPVVRTVATQVATGLRGLFSNLLSRFTTVFRQFTTWVTRFRTQIKQTVETQRKVVPQVTKTVKKVPVKQHPHRGAGPRAKKPASTGKHRLKYEVRNAKSPNKPPKHQWATPKQAEGMRRKLFDTPKGTVRPIERGAGHKYGQLDRRTEMKIDLAETFDPWSMEARTGTASEHPAKHADGTPKFGDTKKPEEFMPASRGSKARFGAAMLGRLFRQIFG
ncbi:RHS repeat domain-containing protein [Kribbella deserti]|uniref:RHS repeat domain-containing protein n=1 Tax=Kribbella deserti TaxID=1926257 RepID=A0ABV6QE31_9ACTN